jgi:hypothetical protein
MAGTVGFLALIQCGERPERYSDPSRFDTIPSQPSKMPPKIHLAADALDPVD